MIGMGLVARSTDFSTLVVVPATTVTLPLFYKSVDFDVINGLAPVTQVASSSFVLAVHKDVPANNLAEFTAWARSKPDLFYASPGNGTHHHLFMELLLQSLGIKLEHAAYKGSAPAVNDLLGGQVPTMFLPIQVAVPLRERHPGFPDIPSLQEQGARNYHADPWFSMWGPPRLPAAQAEQYRAAVAAALAEPAVKESLTKQGLILKTTSPAELLAMTKAESVLWTRVAKDANLKPE
jgi:tripartite-type tricarboxylate transporter receptor subunit TctC